jgi:murein L,D-transpeptidase YcbB/YkuD
VRRTEGATQRTSLPRWVPIGALLTTLVVPRVAAAQPAVAEVIAGIVDAGVQPDLRWPRFPDHQDAVRAAYEAEHFAPLWTSGGKPTRQADALIAAFSDAGSKGLSAADYDADGLAADAARLRTAGAPTAEELGGFDVALTVSLMRFASDSYSGKINPHQLGYAIDTEPKRLDLPELALELARAPDPAGQLAGLDPPFPLYARLRTALQQYRALAARTDLQPVPDLPKLRPGETHPGIPKLRAWLIAVGDLSPPSRAPAQPALYDDALAKAVKRFQRRHGLDADGVIGAGTLHALQVPMAHRARQIELAMERVRWLPYWFPDRFVVVNIPEFRLRGFQDTEPSPRVDMGVVVGSTAEKTYTPVLQADMRYLIFRPYWLVPTSIARKEILPKASHDPSYLARQNMELVDGHLRQRPGPTNSLGLLKFIFPNPFHVYFHDTPAKALFQRTRRDFSHGCIRVSDPPSLAAFVLQDRNGWDRQRIQSAMTAGADNHRVDLPAPIPVYVLYTTANVEPDGQVVFLDDIYGQDASLDALLARGYPFP